MNNETCSGVKLDGSPCEAPVWLVRDGYCNGHRPGDDERRAEQGRRGGNATAAKLAGEAFADADLPRITTADEAKTALDVIRRAILTRRITHAEGNAAAKSVDSWIKADAASITKGLVNELRAELDAKTREIESLRRQLAGQARGSRIGKVPA